MQDDHNDNDEDVLIVPISALEHFSYCPRQCALIHLERVWDESIHTIRGTFAHERVDQTTQRTDRGIRVERGLPLWSRRLGLLGRADVVEFHGEIPYPVEYKVGTKRSGQHEALQLCAQAICLEEMLNLSIPAGAVYYGATRTRHEVEFSATLRTAVEHAAADIRAMLLQTQLPPAPNDARCPKCSLLESCLPAVVVRPRRLQTSLAELYQLTEDEKEG